MEALDRDPAGDMKGRKGHSRRCRSIFPPSPTPTPVQPELSVLPPCLQNGQAAAWLPQGDLEWPFSPWLYLAWHSRLDGREGQEEEEQQGF